MEAATPLPLTQVRFFGDRLVVDGLLVDDECAVRLAKEHDDPALKATARPFTSASPSPASWLTIPGSTART